MAYTPELTVEQSQTLRRIAWALNIPMTRATDYMFEFVTKRIDSHKICDGCRDKTLCSDCVFDETNESRFEILNYCKKEVAT